MADILGTGHYLWPGLGPKKNYFDSIFFFLPNSCQSQKLEPWSFYPKSLEIICPKCVQTPLQVLDYLMKIRLPNPEGTEIFFYPNFYALEFLVTQPFSLWPQPRQ